MDVLALPPQLLHLVLELVDAAGERRSRFVARHFESPRRMQDCLLQLKLVCRAWHHAVDKLETERRARVHNLILRVAPPSEPDERWLERLVYGPVAAKSDTLRELRVSVGGRGLAGGLFALQQELTYLQVVEKLEVDWHRIFASCRKLEWLDLSGVPINSPCILSGILDAASRHCTMLQALVLPGSGMGVIDRQVDLASVMPDLYQALARWSTHGSKQGLTQLTVPKRHNFTDSDASLQQHSDEYLDTVARYCPNIEHLDGWKASYSDETELRCSEVWFCSLGTWRKFCETCTKIREFNWFVAPFDRDYLAAFAASPKPNLTKMTLTCGNDEYFSDVLLSGEYYRAGGFSFSTESLTHVLSACPALRDLRIVFSKLLYRTQWLQERIDDSFLCALGVYCPELERLVIDEIESVNHYQAIRGISDVGLAALARLPQLRSITLKQSRCTAEGILDLILNDPHPRDKRCVSVRVGSVGGPHCVQFYEVLLAILALLLARPAEEPLGYRFRLELVAHGTKHLALDDVVHARLKNSTKALSTHHSSVAVYFCGQTKRSKRIPTHLDRVRSVVVISM
ncbi:hypothetical protein PybrP1_009833 [[Pythium] brassicae (nom. inval.)]|nr:hypothetical protein PybrP1_009833 [[Pythium] brassicae (nom. inval.)]